MSAGSPRLLVATEAPPNGSGGGGAILRQMLKEWPTDRLFWWSCVADIDPRFGQQVAAHRVARIPWKLYPHRKWRRQKCWLLKNVWSPWATRHFRATLAELKPDVVWVIPISWSIPPISKVLASSNLAYHVSVHDYPDCNNWVEQFGVEHTRRFMALTEILYAKASSRDAISRLMLDDLKTRTGCDGRILRSGLQSQDFYYLQGKTTVPNDPIRIAYAGSITWEEDFLCLVRAIDAVRTKLPRPVTLELFSGQSYANRSWFDPAWMREHGNLPEPRFSTELRNCSWGFALMALGEDNASQRFSFPTKFTSYLMAGLPIFSLGHPKSSLTEMAQRFRVGVHSSSGRLEDLTPKVFEAFSIENPWKVFGAEMIRCAREEFDAEAGRIFLYDCFRTCAQETATSRT
jgi:hypothetical protein